MGPKYDSKLRNKIGCCKGSQGPCSKASFWSQTWEPIEDG